MRVEGVKQAIRLRLLALVLALALTWYAMNPAPGSSARVERDEAQPDEQRRQVKSRAESGYKPMETMAVVMASADAPAAGKVDDLDWPEVIEIG